MGAQRRTQEERSAETRLRLIEATLDCLYEEGAARTSTNMIAARAGVSRGALTHHYATKEQLIVEAMEHHLTEATEEIRALAVQMRAGVLGLDGMLDRLCEMFLGRLILLTLEHVTEARHNDNLREQMVRIVRRFHAALDDIWREFFHTDDRSDLDVETTLNMTLCLFRGMGVQSVLRDDPAYYRRLRDAWKAQLRTILGRDGREESTTVHQLTTQGD